MARNEELCRDCGKRIVKANKEEDIYAVCETCPNCDKQMHSNIVCPHCQFDTSYP